MVRAVFFVGRPLVLSCLPKICQEAPFVEYAGPKPISQTIEARREAHRATF